ncbi:MAG: hypothetical protein AAGH90_12180 [Pseudomonadota bacterium]
MKEPEHKSKNFFLALLSEYLILLRNDTKGHNLPLSADIAYALHNVPSMLLADEWSPEIGEAAWKEVWWAAGLRGCRHWFEQTVKRLKENADQGSPILNEFKFDLPKDHP